MSDYDPRIVALYDEDNPDGPDHDFYRSLADEIDARTVLDLGCGTGILTVTFAREVLLRARNLFADAQEVVVEELVLAFRDRERITSQLQSAGFQVDRVWGSWAKQPFTGTEQVMIFEATAV